MSEERSFNIVKGKHILLIEPFLKLPRSLVGQTPIGLLCLALAHWQMPVPDQKPSSGPQLRLRDLDYLGITVFVVSIVAFILGTTDGDISFLPNKTPIFLSVFGVSAAVFFLIERFWAKYPIIPLPLLTAPCLGNIFLGQLLISASLSTVSYTYNSNWQRKVAHADLFFLRLRQT